MGLYDTPAIIDFVLKKTNTSQIEAYVGFSRGTTQFFAGASMKPEFYNKKVNLFIGLAPVTRMSQGSFFFSSAAWFGSKLVQVYQDLGLYSFENFQVSRENEAV